MCPDWLVTKPWVLHSYKTQSFVTSQNPEFCNLTKPTVLSCYFQIHNTQSFAQDKTLGFVESKTLGFVLLFDKIIKLRVFWQNSGFCEQNQRFC